MRTTLRQIVKSLLLATWLLVASWFSVGCFASNNKSNDQQPPSDNDANIAADGSVAVNHDAAVDATPLMESSTGDGSMNSDAPDGTIDAELTKDGACSWKEVFPALTANNLNAVWGTDFNNVYAVGDKGTMLYFDGSSWSTVHIDTRADLQAIWGSGSSDIYAVGGDVLHFNGTEWRGIEIETENAFWGFQGIWGTGPTNVYGFDDYRIFHFDGELWRLDFSASGMGFHFIDMFGSSAHDVWMLVESINSSEKALHFDGESWKEVTVLPEDFDARCGCSNGPDDVYIAASPPEVPPPDTVQHWDGEQSIDMTLEFNALRETEFIDFFCQSPTAVYALGLNRDFYLTERYTRYRNPFFFYYDGNDWRASRIDQPIVSTAIWSGPNTPVIAVGERGGVISIDNDKATIFNHETAPIVDLWAVDPNHIYALQSDGRLLLGSGTEWREVAEARLDYALSYPSSYGPVDLWGAGADHLYAVGSKPDIAAQIDGFFSTVAPLILKYRGSGWEEVELEVSSFLDMWVAPSGTAYFVDKRGVVQRLNGSEFTPLPAQPLAYLYQIWGTSPEDIFAVGISAVEHPGMDAADFTQTLYHFDGQAWSNLGIFAIENAVVELWGRSAQEIYLFDRYGTVLYYDGSSWDTLRESSPDQSGSYHAIWASDPDDIYLASNNLVLHFDGSSWSDITAELQFERVQRIWGSGASNVYATGANSPETTTWITSVVHFNGSSWTELDISLPGGGAVVALQGNGPDDIYIVTYDGEILHFDGDELRTVAQKGVEYTEPFAYFQTYPDGWIAATQSGTVWRGDTDSYALERKGFGDGTTCTSLTSIWGHDPDDIWIACGTGSLLHLENGVWVSIWDELPLATSHRDMTTLSTYSYPYRTTGIWGSGSNAIYVIGYRSQVINRMFERSYKSLIMRYDGETWTASDWIENAALDGVWSDRSGEIYFTDQPYITPYEVHNRSYRFDGDNLIEISLRDDGVLANVPQGGFLRPVEYDDRQDRINTIHTDRLIYSNGVDSQQYEPLSDGNVETEVNAVYAASPQDIYLGTSDGTILHSDCP